MSKTDKTNNIISSIKKRCVFAPSGSYIRDLIDWCDNIGEEDSISFQIVPVRLVAYIEDSLRFTYETLLDQKHLFDSFIEEFLQKHKNFDFVNVCSGNISLKSLIAYTFSCNNLNNIDNNFSSLTGEGILKYIETENGEDYKTQLVKSLDSLFVTRHTLCHEAALDLRISKDKAREWISIVSHFLSCVNKYTLSIVYKDYFLSKKINQNVQPQIDIDKELNTLIKQATNDFEKSENKLESIKKASESDNSFSGYSPKLSFIQDWKTYRDARSSCENPFSDDVLRHQLFSLRLKTKMNEEFLSEIKNCQIDYYNYINHKVKEQ